MVRHTFPHHRYHCCNKDIPGLYADNIYIYTGRDSLGLKVEMRLSVFAVGTVIFIGIPVVIWVLNNDNLYLVIIATTAIIAWSVSIIYPIWLMHRHIRRQKLLVMDVQRFSSLADFLLIPDCVKSFRTFVNAEFNGESLEVTTPTPHEHVSVFV
jgi:hypothetical protein